MKKLLIIFLSLIHLSGLYSLNVDYGATIDSFVGDSISTNNVFFGFEKVSLYGSVDFSKNTSLAFDGYYRLSYASPSWDFKHFLDVSILLFSTRLNLGVNSISFDIGRNFRSDYSGDIFSHTVDGLSISSNLGSTTIIFNAGYTGLLRTGETSINRTAIDMEAAKNEKDINNIRLIIEGIDVVKDISSVSLWGSLYSAQDLRDDMLLKNLPVYIGGGLRGSVKSMVYYSIRGNFKTGFYPYFNADNVLASSLMNAGMGAANVSVITDLMSVSLDAGVSSGDPALVKNNPGDRQEKTLGSVSQYSPLITSGPGVIYSTSNQNLTYGKLGVSFIPVEKLQTTLGSTVFFRTVKALTGDSSLDSSADTQYIGTEVFLTANFRPFSDLGVSFTGGVNIPNGEISSSGITGLVTLYVSLSI
jgi:hypothetical protein